MTHTYNKQQGFTLIEIMVVVVIIGILAGVVGPKMFGQVGKARTSTAKSNIRGIEAALDSYKLDNFDYPGTDQGLEALVTKPSGSPEPRSYAPGGYMKRLPKDPWKRDYLYLNPGEHGAIDIYSLGKDGQPGGEGEDEDIGNWNLG